MATSEIEKLERRYAENPHGLTFAPLAEVHRKNGDIQRALELLKIGLELHPNYIPASIVLGRCHQDLGDLAAAEEAFHHVLRLDDENVIALKSLADINERQDKLEEAERWLRRLVSVDRSNEEAREQLQHLETLKAQQRRRAAAAPKQEPPSEPTPQAATLEAAAAEPATVAPPRTESPPEPVAPAFESLDLTEEFAQSPASTAPQGSVITGASVPPAEVPAAPEPPAAQEGAVSPASAEQVPIPAQKDETAQTPPPLGLVSPEFQAPQQKPGVEGPLGIEIETEQDVVLRSSGASEFSVPDATQDLIELAAKMNATRPRTLGRRASDRATAERLAAAERREAERRESERREAERLEAERLEAERLEAERLEAERAQAERRESESTASEPVSPAASPPLQEPVPVPAPPVTPARSYVARETQGQSVAAFFRALLLARPPEGTQPAASDPEITPVHQDGRSAAPDSVSFDDFFGSKPGGSAVSSSGSEPGKEDLDQFQSWLQNLKR